MASSGIFEEDYADGSDHESLYADSPADGYFSQRDHPQETFVENSSAQAESEAKAREAAQSSNESSTTGPPSVTSPTTTSRSPIWVDESTQLLDAGPAPPDYAAATAHRRSESNLHQSSTQSEQSDNDRNRQRDIPSYGSIHQSSPPTPTSSAAELQWPLGNRNNPFARSDITGEEPQWPLGSRNNPFAQSEETGEEPHWPLGPGGNPFGPNFPFGPGPSPSNAHDQRRSMRDANDEESASQHRAPRWKHGKRSKRRWYKRCFHCVPLSVLNILLLLLSVGLLVLLIIVLRDVTQDQDGGISIGDGTPNSGSGDGSGHEDNGHGDDDVGGNTTHPLIPTPKNPSECAYISYTSPVILDFEHVRDFFFVERVDDDSANYFPGGIGGLVTVVPAEPDQQVDVRVLIAMGTTDPWQITKVKYIRDGDGLYLQAPDMQKLKDHYVSRPCLGIGVTIRIREGVDIGHWRLSTENMDVWMHDSTTSGLRQLPTAVDTTSVSTAHGYVRAEYWSSRETRINTSSGPITGTYALRDLLSLRTKSGAIKVNPDPQKADPTRPKPAAFTAVTNSGSVNIEFPMRDVVERDYQTHVESSSSSINGKYILGSNTVLDTNSGSLNAALLPLHTNMAGSKLYTENRSGSTGIRILPPYEDAGEPLQGLYSNHKSTSGTLNVALPEEWEGTMYGESRTGSISINGDDLKWYTDEKWHVGRQVIVGRRYGTSRMDFKTSSGSVTINVDD